MGHAWLAQNVAVEPPLPALSPSVEQDPVAPVALVDDPQLAPSPPSDRVSGAGRQRTPEAAPASMSLGNCRWTGPGGDP